MLGINTGRFMAFGDKQETAPRIGADRLAAVVGGGVTTSNIASSNIASAVPSSAPARPVSVEPDLSRIRKSRIEETPEERKKRLAAKTVNYTASFIGRLIVIAAASLYGWEHLQMTGSMHHGISIGVFIMAADFVRVAMKAATPGSK